MPISGKLERTIHGPSYPPPIADDWRYPREGQIRNFRTILLFCWAVIVWYVGDAIWNVYQLLHDQPKPHTFNDVIGALLLPYPLDTPGTPFLYIISSATLIMVVLIGCIWALRDKQYEHKVLQAREIHEEVNEDLQNRGVDRLLPRPQGPPVDIARLPHPEKIVGRSMDLQWLLKRLRASKTNKITAVYGLGGIGKTALAAEAIRQLHKERRFRDGIAVIRCQGITNATEVLRGALARFDPHRRPPETSDLSELADVASRLLGGKDALIVLDNVEPNLPIKDVVAQLYTAKGVTLLVTARHILPQAVVPIEASYTLDPLSSQEALDFFAQSLGRRTTNLTPTEHNAAERIVKTLGRHTLAIKIVSAYAASRKRDIGTLANELEDPKQAIKMADDDETPEAVALAFTKSTQALPPKAQQLFAALAAFPTTEFSRRATLALARALDPTTAEMNVDLLVPRALVEASTNESMPTQYDRERRRLHPLMGAFAAVSFTNLSEEEQITAYRAVAAYYSAYTNTASDVALSYDEANIIGTLEWAYENKEEELVVAHCTGMQYFWLDRWRTTASLSYLPWGVKAARSIAKRTNKREDHINAATLALTYGQVLQRVGQIDKAREIFEESCDILQKMNDRQSQGLALALLGEIAQQRGRLKEAEDYYEQSLNILREMDDRQGTGEILTSLGEIAQQRGRLREAESYYKQSLEILDEVQSRSSQVHNVIRLGEVAQQRERMREAEKYYGEALEITREIQNRQGEGWILGHIGTLALVSGQPEEAYYYFKEALTIVREVQHRRGEGWVLGHIGTLTQASGQLEEAEEHYKEALAIAQEIQDRAEEGRVHAYMGNLAQIRGQLEQTEEHYKEALAIASEVQDAINYADVSLTFGAFLVERQGDHTTGCSKLKEAVQLYASMKLPNEGKARRISQQLGCGR